MKNSKLSARDTVLLVILLLILLGVGYYYGFYTPLQNELASVASQSAEIDTQINSSAAKINKMDEMQAELDEILSRPEEEITEIAPYDNKNVVMNQLNGILGTRTQNFSVNFQDPDIQSDGTVRRNISLSFSCDTYAAAKGVIEDLTDSQWRCLVSNLSISSSGGDMLDGGVSVSATITFFESTKLS